MESYKFRLKDPQSKVTPKKQKKTIVFLYFSYGYYEKTDEGKKKYKPLKISTELRLYPYQWNQDIQRMKSNSSYPYIRFNSDLESFLDKVKEVYYANPKASPEALRSLIKSFDEKPIKSIELIDYIDKYIDEIEFNKRMTKEKGEPFSRGTVKNMKTFRTILKEYIKERELSTLNYSDVNIVFFKDYVSFLSMDKNYKVSNQDKHIRALKTIMKASMDEGYHSETGFQHKDFKVKVKHFKSVYLNEKELKKITQVDLSEMSHLEEVRDIFLVGCYTAQRHSDYSKIKEENIKGKFIHLTQKKTGTPVTVPIKSELKKILKKYDNKLPYVYEQKLNKGIKLIAKEAKFNELIEVEKKENGVTFKKYVPKWSLICSHTARRSGATNMYLAGISTIAAMQITGHKTEREFLKYISVSDKENADELSKHRYYK